MGLQQFKRQYRLVIGTPIVVAPVEVPYAISPFSSGFDISNHVANQLTTSPDNGVVITEHQIEFTCTKTDAPSTNPFTIVITNPSEQVDEYLAKNGGNEVAIIFSCNYESRNEDLVNLFQGSVSKVETSFIGTDRKIKLTCGDGYTAIKEARSSRSFAVGTPQVNIFNALLDDLGLPKGNVINPEGSSATGFSYVGKTIEGLIKYSRDIGYRFSVQDNTVSFTPLLYPESQIINAELFKSEDNISSRNTLIDGNISEGLPATGVIGTPSALNDTTGDLQNTKPDQKQGIKFTSLLRPKVKPDDIIYVESAKYLGAYRVTKIAHRGNFRGNVWYSDIEAVAANYATVTSLAR